MTTTHLTRTLTSSSGTVRTYPLCTTKPGRHTSDQAEVDCKKCAQRAGFTPKAKKQSKHVTATCACCFRAQKVKSTGDMFDHGYKRPGDGYIIGGCPGDRYLPYEKSCEGTKFILEMATNALAATQLELANAQAAETFTVTCDNRMKWTVPVETKTVVVVKSGPAVADPFSPWKSYTFLTIQTNTVKSLQYRIQNIQGDISFFREKITQWTQP